MGHIIIKNASKLLLNIYGMQKYDIHKEYRMSKFVIPVVVKEGILLHSCLTGEMLLVFEWNKSFKYLVEHWLYVPNEQDEYASIPGLQKVMSTIYSKRPYMGYDNYDILTTTKCNARCFYCYEHGYEQMSMSPHIAKHLVEFISKHQTGREIKINWYGGEPLLNIDAIDIITAGLRERNIRFLSTMITNGYLFSNILVNNARKSWNLSRVRITLDGTRDKYNAVKAYKMSSDNPFAKVMENADMLLANGISVCFRFNIGIYNAKNIDILADELIAKYNGNRLVSFSVNALNNTDENKLIVESDEIRFKVNEIVLNMKERLYQKGFVVNAIPLPKLCEYLCKADDSRHLLIKPNGDIAFCAEDFNKKSYGNIIDNLDGVRVPTRMKDIRPKREICYSCPLFPSCTLSKDCPSELHVCDEFNKKCNIKEVQISMIMKYNNFVFNSKE